MIPRQLAPGLVVYVTEEEAWRELLLGERPHLPSSSEPLWVSPSNTKLSLVKELALRPGQTQPASQLPAPADVPEVTQV
jgi:hypothetical protein